MKILAISTSTPRGSAALIRDGEATAAVAYVDLQGHAERIFAAIDAALAQAGEHRGAIEALACDVGPGSFTGVRVGVASAKGIALGLGLRLAGVGSLEAMAAAAFATGAAGPGDVVLSVIDAKKSEVYAAVYDASGAELVAPCARPLGLETFALAFHAAPHPSASDPTLRAPAEGSPAAGRRVVVVGEVVHGTTLPSGVHGVRGEAIDLPDAAWIGRIAAARLRSGAPTSGASGAGAPIMSGDLVEPVYVRPADVTPPRLGSG